MTDASKSLEYLVCHFLITCCRNEHLFAKVGDELIWESVEEKLLGVTVDKKLNFNSHLSKLCKRVGQKFTTLVRVAKILPFDKSHCPIVWMFYSRKINTKVNHIHERALRSVYNDYTPPFTELLRKDKSISIHYRNIHYVVIEMYKVANDLCPSLIRIL